MEINLEMIHMLKLLVKNIEATMKNNLNYLQEKMKITQWEYQERGEQFKSLEIIYSETE